MALNDTSPNPPREIVTRERVLPDGTPTDAALALLRSWRAEVEDGRTPASGDVVGRIDHLIETVESLRAEAGTLRNALTSRTTIDEAKGVLMAQRGCTADEAFEVLVSMSQNSNVPLRDVARAVLNLAEDE